MLSKYFPYYFSSLPLRSSSANLLNYLDSQITPYELSRRLNFLASPLFFAYCSNEFLTIIASIPYS